MTGHFMLPLYIAIGNKYFWLLDQFISLLPRNAFRSHCELAADRGFAVPKKISLYPVCLHGGRFGSEIKCGEPTGGCGPRSDDFAARAHLTSSLMESRAACRRRYGALAKGVPTFIHLMNLAGCRRGDATVTEFCLCSGFSGGTS